MYDEEVKVEDQGKAYWVRFDGLTDVADHFERECRKSPYFSKEPSFCGWKLGEETALCLRNGDWDAVKRADRMLAKIEALTNVETSAYRTIAAIAGGAPNVPAHLSNSPLAMRQRRRVIDDLNPITIVVDIVTSGGISHDKIERRGAAILALVRLVGEVRPVSLHVTAGMKSGRQNTFLSAIIDTAPLDLSRAAFALCAPEFQRRVCFGIHDEITRKRTGEASGGTIRWAFGDYTWQTREFPRLMGRLIGGGGDTVLGIPGAVGHSNTRHDALLGDDDEATQWVQSEAQRLLAQRWAA